MIDEKIVLKCYKKTGTRELYNDKPFYMVLKNFEALLNLKPEKDVFYFLMSHSTPDKVTKYTTKKPKNGRKLFVFLELEQHKGDLKKGSVVEGKPLNDMEIQYLIDTHNQLAPAELRTSNAFMTYSTGGGVNLVFLNPDSKKLSKKQRAIRSTYNEIIRDNAFNEFNEDGIYDDSYLLTTPNPNYVRLNIKDTYNPKYGNVFKGITYNANAKPLQFNEELKDVFNLNADIDVTLLDMIEETTEEIFNETDTKKQNLTAYLSELGYVVGGFNHCIHPAHEDNNPSMYIDRTGHAVCKSGTNHSDKTRFTPAELVEAVGGDLDGVIKEYKSKLLLKTDLPFASKITLRWVLREIEDKKVVILGETIDNKSTVYYYIDENYIPITLDNLVYYGREITAQVCNRVLYKIRYKFKNTDVKAVTSSEVYKKIKKFATAIHDNYIQQDVKTLISIITREHYYRKLSLFSVLPDEPKYTIPFKNGLYEIKKGLLRPYRPSDRIFTKIDVKYKKFMNYKEIEDLLNEWTGGEGEQLAIGLARALSRTESGKMIFLLGDGNNGKSYLLEELMLPYLNGSLGRRASGLSIEALTNNSDSNFFLSELAFKSLNISSEIEKFGSKLDGLKNKTVGGDTILVNVKNKQPFLLKNQATFILHGNSMPTVSLNDRPLIRRIQVFMFVNNYSELSIEQIEDFERRTHRKDFIEKFFSYLANVYTKFVRKELKEQPYDLVKERIRELNDAVYMTLKTYYILNKEGQVDFFEFVRRYEIVADKYRNGNKWNKQNLMHKLRNKGLDVDIAKGLIYGISEKGTTPPTGTDDPSSNVKEESKPKYKNPFSQLIEQSKEIENSLNPEYEPYTNDYSEGFNTILEYEDIKEEEDYIETVSSYETLEKVKDIVNIDYTDREIIALDIETTGLVPSQSEIALIQIKQEGKEAFYIRPSDYSKEEMRQMLLELLSGKAILGHNLAFDCSFLNYHYGIDAIKDDIRILDTMVMSRIDRNATSIVDEMLENPQMTFADYRKKPNGFAKQFTLKSIMKFYLGIELDKTMQKSDWSGELTEEQIEYALEDVNHLHDLFYAIYYSIEEKGLKHILDLEVNTSKAIMNANNHTLKIDTEKADELLSKLQGKISNYVEEYNNIMSQMVSSIAENEAELIKKYETEYKKRTFKMTEKALTKAINKLYDKNGVYINKASDMFKFVVGSYLGIEIKKTDKTAIKELKDKHRLFELIETMTKLIKEKEDVERTVYNRTEEGRIISKINQIGTITGRMSSSAIKGQKGKSGINLQQINRDSDFRALFHAGKGKKLVLADYSGMELRIIAKITNEQAMLDIFKNGDDLHTKTASILFDKDYKEMMKVLEDHYHPKYKEYKNLRSTAKSINFLIAYGGGAKALSDGAGVSKEEAERLLEDYKTKVYPALARYISQQNNKPLVKSALGRKMSCVLTIDERQYQAILNEKPFLENKFDVILNANGEKVYYMPQYTNPVNYPIQSTGVDIVKLALVELIKRPEFKTDEVAITHIVHDEIILEVQEQYAHKWATILQETMQSVGNLIMEDKVFMEADANIGDNWNDAK